jgi:hypothetical protein
LPAGRNGGTQSPRAVSGHNLVVTQAAAPPKPSDVAWTATIAAAKSAVIALAVDAYVNSDTPRFSGKAMKVRALGYAAALFVVPVAWRLRGHADPYPRGLDLAVTLPVLADAGGNAVGIYQRKHVDDAIHFANGAILSSVVGSVVTSRVRTSWEAAGVATAVGMAAAGLWEIGEWVGLKLGAKGMDLNYDDTMEDLIETSAGAALGGLVTLLLGPERLANVPGRGADRVLTR